MINARVIAKLIEQNRDSIIDSLEYESIEASNYIRRTYLEGNVDTNYFFQFVYRSFYRLDNAGLSKDFKRIYFEVMERERNNNNISFEDLVKEFYRIPRIKGDYSIQLSFTTKLINTVNPDYPIYDTEVCNLFGYKSLNYISNIDKRISKFNKIHQEIEKAYRTWERENLLEETINLFDKKFVGNTLSTIKKYDFLAWSAGKLLKKNLLVAVNVPSDI